MISSTGNVFRSAIAVVALVAGFVVLMRAASAQEEGKLDPAQDAAYTQRVFAAVTGKDKTYACFTRVYDPVHLAAHPKIICRCLRSCRWHSRKLRLLKVMEPASVSPPGLKI